MSSPLRVRFVLRGGGGKRAARTLAILLDCLTRVNVELMRDMGPARFPRLYSGRFRYQREDYSGVHPEDWRDALEVIAKGGGDCEDLACYRVAELRMRGEAARVVLIETKRAYGRLFHIFVERFHPGSRRYEDPSRLLGMT